MDELAVAAGHRPGRAADPQRARRAPGGRALPWSSRKLVAVPADGRRAVRLGRSRPAAGVRRDRALAGRHRRGVVDVPGATSRRRPRASRYDGDGRFTVSINADRHRHRRPHRSDAGRRRRLACRPEQIDDPDRRHATAAGRRRRRLDGDGVVGLGGVQGCADAAYRLDERLRRRRPGRGHREHRRRRQGDGPQVRRHAFGAQFAEVRVDVDTGEIRVPRMVGVFAAGRIVNAARRARSSSAG